LHCPKHNKIKPRGHLTASKSNVALTVAAGTGLMSFKPWEMVEMVEMGVGVAETEAEKVMLARLAMV
jgi:hypothetical protein